MSSTPPPPGEYGQPDYGQQPAYGQEPGGYPTDPYGAHPGRPAEMPSSVATAVKLIWASIALSLLSFALTFAFLDDMIDEAMKDPNVSGTATEDTVRAGVITGAVIALIIGVALTLLLVTFIKKGANWARITYTVLAVLGLVFGLIGLAGEQPAILKVVGVVSMLLTAAILVFLWKKESNPWFGKAATH